ncbi:TPA: hypothetical protein EYM26_04575 [Candidatus Poribacteria bacterium]|nr:hypothetical protein [Candidatus Poribacteria bacterium]
MGKFATRDATLRTQKSQSPVTGKITETKFCSKIQKMGMQAHPSFVDTGIDCIVLGDDIAGSNCVHRVQITGGSSQGKSGHPETYNIFKPCSAILNNIDIIAVLIDHDFKDTTNPNNGKTGPQDLWYIIPYDVYTDTRMHSKYKINTNGSWGINPTTPNKIPLDHAFEEWNLFRKSGKTLRSTKLVEGFFC